MQYDYEIQHRSGEKHINADALSRLTDCQQCNVKHTDPQKSGRKCNLIETSSDYSQLILFLEGKLNIDAMKGNAYAKHLQNIKLVNNVAVYNKAGVNCLVINSKKGLNICKKFHSYFAHVGFTKLYNSLRNLYMWPNMKRDIFSVVNSCTFCLERKTPGDLKIQQKGLFSEYPFQKVFIDLTGPLPTTKSGNRFLLGIIDGFSKWAELVPLKNGTAEEIADAIMNNWIAGAPETLHSDRGRNFMSELMKKMCTDFGIKKTKSSPYYPKGNSVIERLFKTTKDHMYCVHRESREEWDKTLWKVKLSLRQSFNKSVGL